MKIIEEAHKVKQNNDDNTNNDGNRKPPTVVTFQTNEIFNMKQNHVRLENFILKRNFKEKL